MSLFIRLLFCSCFIAVSCGRSVEEIRAWFVALGVECTKDHPASSEELLMLHQHQIPDSTNAKCLLACIYRKTTWVDSKGTFDIGSATAFIEKEYADDAEKLGNSKKLFDVCKHVNDEAVTDGEKGCERSALLAKCLIENAPKMGFELVI